MPYKISMLMPNKISMDTALLKRADRLTRRAYMHLVWEAYAPVLALGVFCLLLFFAGAFAGLWQRIGDPWRGIALIIALAFAMRAVLRAQKTLKPTLSQARRRVELDNNLQHRPFDTLTDTPAQTHAHSVANDVAWQNHLQAASAHINQAAPSQLRPAIAPLDRYYLRFALPCLVLLAAMMGGGDNYERIRASLTPGWISGISTKTAKYEAWIDPPEYTGRPPSYFKDTNTISAPEGSEFVARISGIKSAPRLILRDGKHTRRIKTTRLGPQSFEARAIVSKDTVASFRIGRETQTWDLNINTDTPPKIQFDETPDAGKRDKLIFSYTLEDDFGVESLALSLHLKGKPDFVETVSVQIPGSSVRSTDREPASLDMTKHKWADKVVIGHLIAVDGKGQIGLSLNEEFIIPNKIFVEPLAKAVAEQRQLILANTHPYAPLPKRKTITISSLENRPMFAVDTPERAIDRAPENVKRTSDLIEIITDHPVGIYDDPTVYMGLRHVYRRLQIAQNQVALAGIPEDLWAIAVRAEFGTLGEALEDMKAAERALNNAMARHAPQREIDTLFDRYDAAVERYMEELTLKAIEDAKNRDKNGDGEGGGGGDSDFNTDEIQKLMDAIEEANRMGDTAAARKALAQLAELLENMQIQMDPNSGGGGDGPSDDSMSEEMKEALEDLNDILGEQRKLRDETQSAGRADSDNDPQQGNEGTDEGGRNEAPPKSGDQLAQEQNQLNDLLENLEKGTGSIGEDGMSPEIKQALKDAKNAMRESEDALKNGQYYRAGREQSKVIDALREAGSGIYAEQAKQNEDGQNENGDENANGENADPFGRENDQGGVGDDLDVEADDRQRARELLEQLRQRSGEQDRDKTERDYLERLLERF